MRGNSKIIINCSYCNIEYLKYKKQVKPNNYCCRRCKDLHQKVLFSGENNPNFNNKWNEEQRRIGSEISKKRFESEEMRYKAGSANRGKKFSKEKVSKMHDHRTSESYSRKHTSDSKIIIGIRSKEKFTEEYKQNHRQTMEKLGYWIPLIDKDPYKIYYEDANWICSMIEYFSEYEQEQLTLFGIFNRNNTNGWVRDHILPRNIGYEFKIPYQLLRHPANLQFIPHNMNISKGFSDRKLLFENKIDLIDVLYKKILSFDKTWVEHKFCLHFINEGG
jgi:hypothetical protein